VAIVASHRLSESSKPDGAKSIPEVVLNFGDARHIVEGYARSSPPPASENVSLSQAQGRSLAQQVIADRDLPPFPRATRDGYAVRSAEVVSASQTAPVRLKVVAEIRAGVSQLSTIQPGEAAEIMTGAPSPVGADAVVMVEYSSRQADFVFLQRGAHSGENIVPAGSEARRGQVLLSAGHRMDAAAIALAASVGCFEPSVYQRPQVAILATGDEIVDVHSSPAAYQIRNSNSYSLAAQTSAVGADPVQLPIAPDALDRLRELVRQGLAYDLLLLSGGVSMGKHDLVEQVLRELGAEFFFTGALIQPGRPVVFGRVPAGRMSRSDHRSSPGGSAFFGLPGNPVSTMVTFDLFVKPVIDALCGTPPVPLRFLSAKLKAEIRVRPGLTRFLPALLSGEFALTEVELVPWQGSGDIVAMSRANCYAVVPPDREQIAAGEMVAVMPR
jgi:molybdopterin molybdotransferase